MLEMYSGPFSLNLEGLSYCYTYQPRGPVCCWRLKPRPQLYLLYRRGQGCSLLSSLQDARAGAALFHLGEGWDRLDLPLPHPHPTQCPRNARAPIWAQLCSAWKKAKAADSTGCLDPHPGLPRPLSLLLSAASYRHRP